jgi:hypothetical protein
VRQKAAWPAGPLARDGLSARPIAAILRQIDEKTGALSAHSAKRGVRRFDPLRPPLTVAPGLGLWKEDARTANVGRRWPGEKVFNLPCGQQGGARPYRQAGGYSITRDSEDMQTIRGGSAVTPLAASRPMAARIRAKARLQDTLGSEALAVDEALAEDQEGSEEGLPAQPVTTETDPLTFCARLWCVCTKQPFDPDYTTESPEFLEFLEQKGSNTPKITPLFDIDYYAEQLSWQIAPINYYLHYCESAMDVALQPHVLFDGDYVLSQSGLATFDRPPLLYFLEQNDPNLSPHPLFEPALYSAAVGEDFLGDDLPICAFIERWTQKNAPFSSFFSRKFYALHEPVVRYGGLNPLVHFLSAPPERRRDPNPMFHRGWYANSLVAEDIGVEEPLVHYIRHGLPMGLMPNPFAHGELHAASLGLPALIDALRRYLSFPVEPTAG